MLNKVLFTDHLVILSKKSFIRPVIVSDSSNFKLSWVFLVVNSRMENAEIFLMELKKLNFCLYQTCYIGRFSDTNKNLISRLKGINIEITFTKEIDFVNFFLMYLQFQKDNNYNFVTLGFFFQNFFFFFDRDFTFFKKNIIDPIKLNTNFILFLSCLNNLKIKLGKMCYTPLVNLLWQLNCYKNMICNKTLF